MRSIGLQPRIELHQRFGSESIEAPLRVTTHFDQAGIAQHLEMTRHARLMHADLVDKIAHRTLAIANRDEDAPPCRFGDHFEDVERNGHGG